MKLKNLLIFNEMGNSSDYILFKNLNFHFTVVKQYFTQIEKRVLIRLHCMSLVQKSIT